MISWITKRASFSLDDTAVVDESGILADASSGELIITLPTLRDNQKDGTTFGIMKIDSSGNAVKAQTQDGQIILGSFVGFQTTTQYLYMGFVIIQGRWRSLYFDSWTGF